VLWSLILLQSADGSFNVSDALATVCRAGEPEKPVYEEPMCHFLKETLISSVPVPLKKLIDTGAASESQVHSIWATLLACARYRTLPYSWCLNPSAPVTKRVYIDTLGHYWLKRQQEKINGLEAIAEEINDAADAVTLRWTNEHIQRLEEAKVYMMDAQDRIAEESTRKHGTICITLRQLYDGVKWLLYQMFHAHPVFALYSVGPTESFSRGERVIILCTGYMVMLVSAVWFYQSKAEQCCRDLRSELGCSDDLSIPCYAKETCKDIMKALLRDEFANYPFPVKAADWECDAFPTDTLSSKIYLVLLVCAIVIPLRTFLTAVFTFGGSTSLPKNWIISRSAYEKVFTPGIVIVAQSVAFLVHSIFFEIDKIVKAMTGIVVSLFFYLLQPLVNIKKSISKLDKTCALCFPSLHKQCCIVAAATPKSLKTPVNPGALQGVHYEKTFNSRMDQVGIVSVVVIWAALLWVLLGYARLIHDMYGQEEEIACITDWGLSLLFELFGVGSLQVLVMRVGVSYLMAKLEARLTADIGVFRWYEENITRNLFVMYKPLKETLILDGLLDGMNFMGHEIEDEEEEEEDEDDIQDVDIDIDGG